MTPLQAKRFVFAEGYGCEIIRAIRRYITDSKFPQKLDHVARIVEDVALRRKALRTVTYFDPLGNLHAAIELPTGARFMYLGKRTSTGQLVFAHQ